MDDNQKKLTILDNIVSVGNLPTPSDKIDAKPANARGILQGEYGFVNGDQKQHILGSLGAGPCLLVAAYNPDTKSAMLAHVDSQTKLSSLKDIIEIIKKNSKADSKIQIHIAGGDKTSEEMVSNIIGMIKRDNKLEIKTSDIFSRGNIASSLAIDSSNGNVTSNLLNIQLDFGRRETGNYTIPD